MTTNPTASGRPEPGAGHDPAAALGHERRPYAVVTDATKTRDRTSGHLAVRLGVVAAGDNGPAYLAHTFVAGTPEARLAGRELGGPDVARLERDAILGRFVRLSVTFKAWRQGRGTFVRIDRIEGLDIAEQRQAALRLRAWDWLLDDARGRVGPERLAAVDADARRLNLDPRELAAHLLVIEESDVQRSLAVYTSTARS